jgi:hypothetical protein
MIEKIQILVMLSVMAYLCYGAALIIKDKEDK